MRRLKEAQLLEWYKDTDRKPLLVLGARQVGKTYLIVKLFAASCFKDYVYIDLKKDTDACSYFSETCNPDDYLRFIEIKYGKKISEKVPLLFDEVQVCPNVITSLKYFCQDHRELPVIATGSMVRLSLKENSKKYDDFLFPVGKINTLYIYPMTFEEYLLNKNPIIKEEIQKAFQNKRSMADVYHQMAMDLLHEYLVIGGMPEVVDEYLKTGSYTRAKRILNDIYDNYIGDMSSYNVSNETILKTKRVFKNIFSQLNKENKNFKVTALEKNKSNRDYFNAYDWLQLSGLVCRSKNLSGKITLPISEETEGLFRLYLGDIGLFTHQSNSSQIDFFVRDNRNTLSGIFYENYIADEFVAKGIPLYYWTGKSSHEFEFVVYSNDTIYAIDAKKGKRTTKSLDEFRNYNGNAVFVKVSSNNFGFNEENNSYTIPQYATFALAEYLKNEKGVQ